QQQSHQLQYQQQPHTQQQHNQHQQQKEDYQPQPNRDSPQNPTPPAIPCREINENCETITNKQCASTDIAQIILDTLDDEQNARSFDEIVELSKLAPEQVTAYIVPLEIRRQVIRRNGLYWKRTPKQKR
ncbi:MAG: hypothetical protein MI744_12795, partial [Pseudomonadales bacterium]|nr:hypothetical protein [Pseudomonadales bacterium]